MKKIIACFVALLLISPGFASASTLSELQAQISALLKQITSLQQQLNQQVGQQNSSSQTPNNSSDSWCYNFNTNLRVGSEGDEVYALSLALNREGFGLGKFDRIDEATASAIVRFQEKYRSEILTPVGLYNGSGFVGPTTRAKLNALYGCKNNQITTYTTQPTSTSNTPTIKVLSPASIKGGLDINPGINYIINWTSTGITKVKPYLCTYSGSCKVLGAVPSTGIDASPGSFSWYVDPNHPYFPGQNLRIKIEDASNSNVYAYSGYFDVNDVITQASVQVGSPNGGEQFLSEKGGFTAKWKANYQAVNLYLVYADSKENIAQTIGTNVYGETLSVDVNTNLLEKDVNSYKLKVCLYANPSVCDTSDGKFSFVSNNVANSVQTPSITVFSPSGGEQWAIGSTQTIRWSDTAFSSNSHYTVFITRANGGAYGIAANDVYGKTTFNWTVGNVTSGDKSILDPGSNYYVQVVKQYTNDHASDQNDKPFSIVASSPTIDSFSVNGYSEVNNWDGKVHVYNVTNPIVQWSSSNASYCKATSVEGISRATTEDFTGTQPTSGSKQLMIGDSYYNQREIWLTCYNQYGTPSNTTTAWIGGKG